MVRTGRKVRVHEPWCVREHNRGSCSEKRGHWDRSTNTWDSDLTTRDREAIAEGLRRWREGSETRAEVMAWVRANSDTLGKVDDMAILTWNMSARKAEKEGRSWPI